MGGALVQAAWGAVTGSGTTCTVACPISPTVGNTIVVLGAIATPSTFSSITDTLSNSYTQIFADTGTDATNSGFGVYAFYTRVATGGANTITAHTGTAGSELIIMFVELSGIAISPIDGSAISFPQSVPGTGANGIKSPAASNSKTAFVLGFCGDPTLTTDTITAGTSPIAFTSSNSTNITASTTAWWSGTAVAMIEWAAGVTAGSHQTTFTDATSGGSNFYYGVIIMLDESVPPVPLVGQTTPTSGGTGNISGGSNSVMWTDFIAYASGTATNINAYINSAVATTVFLGLYKPTPTPLVQSNNFYQSSSVSSQTLTFNGPVTAGNTLFVCTNTFGSGGVTISDNLNGTWGTFDVGNSVNTVTRIYSFPNTLGGNCTVTVAVSLAAKIAMWIGEVSGLLTAPLDVTANGSATFVKSISSGATAAVNTVPEFMLAVAAQNSGTPAIPVGGLTLDANVGGFLAVSYGTASASGTQSATYTFTVSVNPACLLATYTPKLSKLGSGNGTIAVGLNTFSISGSPAINYGQQYIIAFQAGNTSSLTMADDGTTAQCFFGTNTAGSMPATLPAPGGQTNLGVPSVYISGTPAAGAQGTPLGGPSRVQWHWRSSGGTS